MGAQTGNPLENCLKSQKNMSILEDIRSNPRLINSLLKDELLKVACELEITGISRSSRKATIRRSVVEVLVGQGIVEMDSLEDEDEEELEEKETVEGKKKYCDDLRLKEAQLKYEFELEKRKIECTSKTKGT